MMINNGDIWESWQFQWTLTTRWTPTWTQWPLAKGWTLITIWQTPWTWWTPTITQWILATTWWTPIITQ